MDNVVVGRFRKHGPRLSWRRGKDGEAYAFTGSNSTGWRIAVYSLITVIGDHHFDREFSDDVQEMMRAEKKCRELVLKRFGGVLNA